MLIKSDPSGKRLAEVIRLHLQRVSSLYDGVVAGENIQPKSSRVQAETHLFNEMNRGLGDIEIAIEDLRRPRPIRVANASPKPAWAHVYYLSLHDPANSTGPTEGFYPVFLMSVDHQLCWLSVCLAAASVGISGRGGWSKAKGELLKERAVLLGLPLRNSKLWIKGPITLGTQSSYLHLEKGTKFDTGRAYECGAIISTKLDPHNPPDNLATLLLETFQHYDKILPTELNYLESALPQIPDIEWTEQVNAAVIGRMAEKYCSEGWFRDVHPEWGQLVDKTNFTGLGYDFGFPEAELFVEVKGFRYEVDAIRLTEREWTRAKKVGNKFILCLVSNLEAAPKVHLIYDPHKWFSENIIKRTFVQTTYSVSKQDLRKRIKAGTGAVS